MTFFDVWIGYTVFGISALSAVFIWAVRNRQFSDLDRAGYIVLDEDEPEDVDTPERVPSWIDRYTPAILASLVCISLVLMLWLGLNHA